jgi:hypothetical protein
MPFRLCNQTLNFLFLRYSPDQASKLNNVGSQTMSLLQNVVSAVHQAFADLEGSVNNFRINSHGAQFVGSFGMSPRTHKDDPIRCVLACLRMRESIASISAGLKLAIGVCGGRCMSIAVGSGRRRDFAMAGDAFARAQRFMRAATDDGIVLCDEQTMSAARDFPRLRFVSHGRRYQNLLLHGSSTPDEDEPAGSWTPHWNITHIETNYEIEKKKYSSVPIGRQDEVLFLTKKLSHLLSTNEAHVVLVSGHPGV